MRVQEWDNLVSFVLGMDITEVHRLANGRRTFDAPAPKIPVTLGYFTRFPDASGQIVDHPDIYGLGRAMNTAAPDEATCEVADLVD